MAVVVAKDDLYAANGKMLVAKKGRRGVALRKLTTRQINFNKVPVRWKGRRKVYWHWFDDLEFISSELDPTAYIAVRPNQLLDIPSLPQPPSHYSYNFGENLKYFRKERGLSQSALAKLMVLDNGETAGQTSVSYWERNAHAPSGSYIVAIAKALGVPPFMFFVNLKDCEWMRGMRLYIDKLSDILCEEASI